MKEFEKQANGVKDTRNALWRIQKVLLEITPSIADAELKSKSNNARIELECIIESLKDLETFLWAQNSN